MVTLFECYPVKFSHFYHPLSLCYRIQFPGKNHPLGEENLQLEAEMHAIHLHVFLAKSFVLPGILQFSLCCLRIKPRELQLNIPYLLTPVPFHLLITPCSHHFMPSLPETPPVFSDCAFLCLECFCGPSRVPDSHSPVLSLLSPPCLSFRF